MADKTPIRVVVDGSGNTTGLSEFQSGETLGLLHGGTGATTASTARTSLGLHAVASSGSYTDLINIPATPNSDAIAEGTTNLYYTNARVAAYLNANSYVVQSYVDTALANVLDGAPGVLDTLNELAAAIGDDANFAVTIQQSIADVQTNLDGNFASKTTTDLAEGTNLYYTDARVRSHIQGTTLAMGSNDITTTGKVLFANMYSTEANLPNANNQHGMFAHVHNTGKGYFAHGGYWRKLLDESSSTTSDLSEGSNLYFTNERVDDRVSTLVVGGLNITSTYNDVAGTLTLDVDNSGGFDLASNSTSDLQEGSNLYYTDARVLSYVTTFNYATQSYVDGIVNPVTAQFSGLVSDLDDEIFDREEADNAINTTISNLTTTDIAEGTNLYYTNTRARGSISVTGDLTYDSATGVISTQGLASSTTDDLSEGTSNLYYTQARFDSAFTAKSTTNLSEGSNLYFTNERVDDRVSALIQAGSNVTVSYDDANNTLTISATEDNLSNNTTDDLTEGSSNLYYTESRTDARIALQAGANLDLSNQTTTDLAEGTNLYYTQSRFDSAFTAKSTTDLSEGTNLYYTAARDTAQFNTDLATKSTTNLAEGTNLYFTNARVQTKLGDVSGHIIPDTDVTYDLGSLTHKFRDLYLSGSSIILGTIELKDNGGVLEQIPVGGGATLTYATQTYVTTQIANLVDTAPTTLDTLNELAAALGDDPNFATTITNSIATKLATADFTSTANTWLSTKSTSDITEGTNLYYTDARVRNQLYNVATVTTSAGNFYIDGEQQVILTLQPGRTYRFDQSDASNTSHPLKFSEVSDGTHAGGNATEYTTGVTVNGTAGSAGAYVEITVTNATPRLYYYCANHSGMGGSVGVGRNSIVDSITSSSWITGPIQTSTVNVGTGGSISATLGTVDFTNSTVVFSGATVNGLSNSDVGLANIADNGQGVVVTGKVAADSLDIGTGGSINAALTTVDFSSSTVVFSSATVNGLGSTINDQVDFHLNQSGAASNQVLSWNGTDYAWVAQSTGPTDTDSLPEGSTNLYYTDARADARVVANTVSIVSDLDDEIFDRETADADLQTQINAITTYSGFDTDFAAKSTTDLSEGTNLYYTESRTDARVALQVGASLDLSNKTTSDLSEGTNLYYTDARALAATDGQIVKFANMYSAEVNLPSATTYHGMFAHVHGTGKGYFAHAGSWIKLIDESSSTTTNLTEGTNLYYTDSRVDARITNAGSVTQSDIDTAISNLIDSSPATLNTLNELAAALGDDANFSTTITNSIALKLNIADAATVLTDLGITDGTTGQLLSTDGSGNFSFTTPAAAGSSIDISATAPSSPSAGDLWFDSSTLETYIYYNDGTTSQWVEAASGSGGAGVSDTDDVSEGTTNLYYTDARVQTKLGDISGNIIPDTDVTYDLGSSTHKFRDLYLSGSTIHLGSIELSDNGGALEVTPIAGGSTSTFATTTYVTTAISNLVDTAPATLDTLNELAAALGDDANFSTTVTNSIATKLATADFTSTANTWLTTKSTTDLSEGTNLYYTDARVRTHITGADLDMGSNDITTTGKMLFANMYATTGDLPSATTYHGMFAHVHGTGKGYFAHGGNWVELANNSQIIAQDFSWASITGTPTTIAGYGITDAFDGTYASLTGTPTIPTSIDNLTDVDISTAAPTDGQTLVWDNANSKFIPGAASGGGGAATLQVSDAAPSSATANDLWLNSTNMKLFVYYSDGTSSQWVEIGAGGTISGGGGGGSSVTVSDAAPSSPADGDMWFNSTDTKLYIYYNDGSSSQWVQALPSGGSGSGSSASSNTWVEKTTAYTVVAGEKLLVDCSSAAVTVTLPASAALGEEIRIIDATGNSSTNNITIARNGHKIQGASDDLTINTDRAAFGLVYYNAAQGWLLTER